jgi:hypothetical protein
MLWKDIVVKSVDMQTPATSKLGVIILDVESALVSLWYLQVDLVLQIMRESLRWRPLLTVIVIGIMMKFQCTRIFKAHNIHHSVLSGAPEPNCAGWLCSGI